MSEPRLTREEMEAGDPARVAAFNHRSSWLDQANAPGRFSKQIPPLDEDWDQLIFRAGRGWGKTQSLVEWAWWEGWQEPLVIHAIAPTFPDVDGTLMLGPAGFRATVPAECLRNESWERAYVGSPNTRLYLKNGTIIRGFGVTGGGPRLRGPQCHAAICDELREWDRPAGKLEEAYDNMMFGLRLKRASGKKARVVSATTPKPISFLRKLYKSPGVRVVTGTSYENASNLDPGYRQRLFAKEGTRTGRIEIHAEDISDEEGAIFKRSWFRLWPYRTSTGEVRKLPEFSFLLMTMDTAFEEENYHTKKGKDPDYSACAVMGVFNVAQCFNEEERKRLKIKTKYAAVICDFWMERLDYPDLLEKARKTYRTKWGGENPRYPDVVLIEKKASGISLRQSLMKYGVPTWGYDPKRMGKTERANAASPYVLQGHLFIPESTLPYKTGEPRDWVEPLLEQMCSFQGEGSIEHEDGMDACVQGILHLAGRGLFHIQPEGSVKPDPDEKEEAEQKRAMAEYEKQKRGSASAYGS